MLLLFSLVLFGTCVSTHTRSHDCTIYKHKIQTISRETKILQLLLRPLRINPHRLFSSILSTDIYVCSINGYCKNELFVTSRIVSKYKKK